MYLIELLLSTLSTWCCVEVLHHSQFFSRFRAYIEARGGFINDLVSCPYCLSHWIGAGVSAISIVVFESTLSAGTVGLWFLIWTAAVRCANLLNDVTHSSCRTPRESGVPEFQMEDKKGTTE